MKFAFKKKNVVFVALAAVMFVSGFIFSMNWQTSEAAFAPVSRTGGMTLVIDPGHGGEDGGSVSISGVRESEINLDIALKMEQIMGLFGISPVLTRESEEIHYGEDTKSTRSRKSFDQNSRVQLVNSFDRAVLISIHQNKFTNSRPFGAQVLYSKTEGSSVFAEYMQNLLVLHLNPTNYRVAAPISDSIYLMKKVACPAILIECGFLSNPADEALLLTEEYRLKLAAVISAGYLKSAEYLSTVNY